ncbi:MAG: hypothetical protein U0360_07645 [Dehalococcoidia bacterium]
MVAELIRQQVEVSFDQMGVLEDEAGTQAFILDWNLEPVPPPYYLLIDGRRFAYSGETLLVKGHGARFGRIVREHEAAGRIAMFVERETRLYIYVFDPSAADDESE